MKTAINLLLLVLLISTNSCSKQDDCENPVDCLPPLTQTGEGTIGCLINGQPFKPGGSQLSGPTQQAFYQFVDGKNRFGLSANNRDTNQTIRIFLRNQTIQENQTFILTIDEEDSNVGEYKDNLIGFHTNEENRGEIIFTNFDNIKGIVSGTFWFDAVNGEGEVVEIREGRFDMKYH